MKETTKIAYHLPGLFEFYSFYKEFLPLYYNHPEYFYEWCEIGSIYGAPANCLWGGGRTSNGEAKAEDVLALMKKYEISTRFTFSNSLLTKEHLNNSFANELCKLFEDERNGIIIYSDLLLEYLKEKYPKYYYVSSTTKVITDFKEFVSELENDDFKYVVPDFRLNKRFTDLEQLESTLKDKVEFLCNECCDVACLDRKKCYENVSRLNLNEDVEEHVCQAPRGNEGYKFSRAMTNPSFISLNDIQNIYLPMGFTNFKIEGRGLGTALLLEFILYYMVKPEYQLVIREELYLDTMLDLF